MHWSRQAMCAGGLIILAGCSTGNYIGQNYPNESFVTYHDDQQNQNYKISDRPAAGRMMMTLGDMEQANVALFTGDYGQPPLNNYKDAAVRWLARAGRTCTASSIEPLIKWEYEVSYSCQPSSTAKGGTGTGL